jgi:hypothetical protein
MWIRLRGLYSKRIVNVNVNIVAAGILALLPTLIAVHLAEHWLSHETRVGHELKLRLATHYKFVISAVTFVVDVCSDVCFYYALHFLANHWPKALKYKPQDDQHTKVPFFKDATLVQFQRMILSPLLYTLWLGTQQILMQVFDAKSVWATAIGCMFAIAVVRAIHTVWMVKAAKKALATGNKLLHDLAPKVWPEPQAKNQDCPLPPHDTTTMSTPTPAAAKSEPSKAAENGSSAAKQPDSARKGHRRKA